MELNDLLKQQGYDSRRVIVMRHRPKEPELNKVFPWIAEEHPTAFNAYQQCHGKKVEKALLTADYIASFVGIDPGTADFVGLYRIAGHKPLTHDEYWQSASRAILRKHGLSADGHEDQELMLEFDLQLTGFYASWKGKLRISWPPPERSWWRRAQNNVMPVLSIVDESRFDLAIPHWWELVRSWDELALMPESVRARISQWRAIYYIHDKSDGLGYVGSAYGTENLLGRWLNYAKTGHGGNRLLRSRNPENFVFSILQLVPHDTTGEDLVRLESSWKQRLHSRHPTGLNDN